MPELPEVETVARGLTAALQGARIASVAHLRAGIFHSGNQVPRAAWNARLSGRSFLAFRRRAKWLVADLGGLWWIVHLRMTGRLLVVEPAAERPKHTHFELQVLGGCAAAGTSGDSQNQARLLRFVDPRRFGRMMLVEQDPFTSAGAAALGDLGPEPLEVGVAEFMDRARARPTTRLKALLLDQAFVAGLGNIYVDESLFVAGLAPTAQAGRVPRERLADLHAAIQAVLTKAIRLGGTSMRDYIHPDGSYGAYHEQFLAYGRGGEPCSVCKTTLTETRLGQRATVYCEQCQRTRRGRGLALGVLR